MEIGSRRRGFAAALFALAIGLVIGAVVWGIFSTRALTQQVRQGQKTTHGLLEAVDGQNARIEQLAMQLQQAINAQPGLSTKLAADILRQIEALKFTVRQEGARVILVPQRVTSSPRPTPTPSPTLTSPTCRKHRCH